MINYRSLTDEEINRLESQLCSASDWKDVWVAERFTPDYVHHARFPERCVWEYLNTNLHCREVSVSTPDYRM